MILGRSPQDETPIRVFSGTESFEERRAPHRRKIKKGSLQRSRNQLMYQRELARVVQFQSAHDVWRNIGFPKESQSRIFQTLTPCGHALPRPEIGIKKIPARTQNPANFREKSIEGWIAMRRFHVDDHVEGTILER
jgi:hypothetical protein